MNQSRKNVLISLESRYATGIISGEKKVELRNRRMNLSKDDIIWVYSKQPHGRVVMTAVVREINKGSPKLLWNQCREICGMTKKEFFTYFGDVEIGYAIYLCNIKPLPDPVSLEKIREKDKNFHPPQFSKYLMDRTPLLEFLESCLIRI